MYFRFHIILISLLSAAASAPPTSAALPEPECRAYAADLRTYVEKAGAAGASVDKLAQELARDRRVADITTLAETIATVTVVTVDTVADALAFARTVERYLSRRHGGGVTRGPEDLRAFFEQTFAVTTLRGLQARIAERKVRLDTVERYFAFVRIEADILARIADEATAEYHRQCRSTR